MQLVLCFRLNHDRYAASSVGRISNAEKRTCKFGKTVCCEVGRSRCLWDDIKWADSRGQNNPQSRGSPRMVVLSNRHVIYVLQYAARKRVAMQRLIDRFTKASLFYAFQDMRCICIVVFYYLCIYISVVLELLYSLDQQNLSWFFSLSISLFFSLSFLFFFSPLVDCVTMTCCRQVKHVYTESSGARKGA